MDSITPPQYIQDLVDIIKEMSNKIDNLENKIDEMREQILQNGGVGVGGVNSSRKNVGSVVPDFTPSMSFQDWLQSFDIGKNDIMVLLGTNIVEGFKCCLIKHISESGLISDETYENPIWVSSHGRYKQIYIYDVVDCLQRKAHWRIMTEDDVYLLIDIIWRKMIEYYFVTEEENMEDILSENEQTQRDINKKVLLDSKKRLQKHTKEIQRCIIGIFSG